MRFAILLEVFLSGMVFFGRVVGGGNIAEAFGTAIGSGVTGAMTLIGFATVAAWLIERKGITIDYFNTWRVRDLRFLDFAVWDWADVSEWISAGASKHKRAAMNSGTANNPYDYIHTYGWTIRQSSAGRGVGAIVVGVVFILWWMGVLHFGLTPIAVDYSTLHINPGLLDTIDYPALKAALYWPVLVYFAALIAFGAVVLIYPRGVRLRGLIDMALGLSSMALVAWVWTGSPIANIVRVDTVQAFVSKVQAFFQHPLPFPLETGLTIVLILTAFGGFCRAVGGLWEVITGFPRYRSDG